MISLEVLISSLESLVLFFQVRGHPILKFCLHLRAAPLTPTVVIAYQVKLNPLSEILAMGLVYNPNG